MTIDVSLSPTKLMETDTRRIKAPWAMGIYIYTHTREFSPKFQFEETEKVRVTFFLVRSILRVAWRTRDTCLNFQLSLASIDVG